MVFLHFYTPDWARLWEKLLLRALKTPPPLRVLIFPAENVTTFQKHCYVTRGKITSYGAFHLWSAFRSFCRTKASYTQCPRHIWKCCCSVIYICWVVCVNYRAGCADKNNSLVKLVPMPSLAGSEKKEQSHVFPINEVKCNFSSRAWAS